MSVTTETFWCVHMSGSSGATKIRFGTKKKKKNYWSYVKRSRQNITTWEDILIIFSTWAEFFPAMLNG